MSHFTPSQIRMLSEFVSNGLRILELAHKEDIHIRYFINGLQLFFPLFLQGALEENIKCLNISQKEKQEIKELLLVDRH